jgi:hypothetical protein
MRTQAKLLGLCIAVLIATVAARAQVDASSITSGTLADARLAADVPFIDAANTFTQSQTISYSDPRAVVLNVTNQSTGGAIFLAEAGTEPYGFSGTIISGMDGVMGFAPNGMAISNYKGPLELGGYYYPWLTLTATSASLVTSLSIGGGASRADLGVDGNIYLTNSSSSINFPDGTTQTTAASASGSTSVTTVGTITSGTWNGSPLTASYLPSDVDYTDTTQTITGQKSFSSNVGIGTTSPGSKLEIDGNRSEYITQTQTAAMPDGSTYDVGGIIYNDNFLRDTVPSNPAAYIKIRNVNTYNAFPTAIRGTQIELGTANGLNGQGTQATTALTITPNGSVGIGTTNPAGTMDIQRANDSGTILSLGNGGEDYLFSRNAVTGALSVQGSQTGYNNIVLAPTSGNVGIGTTTPGAALEVNGGIKLSSGVGNAITFQDGTIQRTAASATGSTSVATVGTITSGTWNGSPLTASYLPSDLLYTDTNQTISGQKTYTAPQIGTFTTSSLPLNGWATAAALVNGLNGYLYLPSSTGSANLCFGGSTTGASDVGGYGGVYIRGQNSIYAQTCGSEAYENTLGVFHDQVVSLAPIVARAGIQLPSGSGASMTFPDGTVQATAWNGTTLGGDYAESVDVTGDRKAYEPGDVMVIDPESPDKFLKASEPYSTMVAGIYSTKPGLTGRRQQSVDPTWRTDEVPMAMMGIVPTKVSAENGAIKPGDLLVASSTAGYAMKGTDRERLTGAVIGKAMGHLDAGKGVIEVLVSLQ